MSGSASLTASKRSRRANRIVSARLEKTLQSPIELKRILVVDGDKRREHHLLRWIILLLSPSTTKVLLIPLWNPLAQPSSL
jgi:hypothetical protein